MEEGAEILTGAKMARRGKRMLEALAETRGPQDIVENSYTGARTLLVMYGVGLPERFELMRRHMAAGGHVACWDLGYWDRQHLMRVSIDGLHPTAEQIAMAPETGSRAAHDLREDADADGPVLLVGMGLKSVHMYGLQPFEWESRQIDRIRAQWPGRRILWRPKKGGDTYVLPGTELQQGVSIEQGLQGCSAVVCRHSNVAVDACIAGVPVYCEGGAAHALYRATPSPTRLDRAEFLRRLGWWQWGPDEAVQAWQWMRKACA